MVFRRAVCRPPPLFTSARPFLKASIGTEFSRKFSSLLPERKLWYSTAAVEEEQSPKKKKDSNGASKWYTLPTYTPSINPSQLGKEISGSGSRSGDVTAIKWVLRCCPSLPRSLVHKLFRLRQIKREVDNDEVNVSGAPQLKRVGAKDLMNLGDRVCLPNTVLELSEEKKPSDKKPQLHCSEEEINFLHSLVLYEDPAIMVVNKPYGLPCQGGAGIKWSLDDLAAAHLKNKELIPPRLVHRLDRDSSGVLVLGRTQTSATVLHAIFREKTLSALDAETGDRKGILQRKYWALVKGVPKRSRGFISAPLGKVEVDDGKSERMTLRKDTNEYTSQTAVTEYRVIKPASHGFTWLELSPLTGRKHQLRIHCAMVLGTPIVGDYKYGWQVHQDWEPVPGLISKRRKDTELHNRKTAPFGLTGEDGSVSEMSPRLHLHCKQMVLPDVSLALQNLQLSSDFEISDMESLEFSAPLPPHMQRSWEILDSASIKLAKLAETRNL